MNASGPSSPAGPWGHRWRVPALLAAYPLAWTMLDALSTAVAFWPVVLRFLLVWWLPQRHWPALAAIDIGGTLLARYVFEGETIVDTAQVLVSSAPVLLTMAVVALLRGRQAPSVPDAARPMVTLIAACTLSAFAVAPTLVVYLQHYRHLPIATLDRLLGFGFGDLFALLALVPLAVAVRHEGLRLWRRRRWWLEGALGLGISLAMLALARGHPGVDEALVLLSFLPVLVLAFRHGWVGAAWAFAVLALLLAFGAEGVSEPLRVQGMAAVFGGTSLLLGAAATQLRAQREALEAQHAALRLAMLDQRGLAARIVALDEAGQRQVAESLHEQVAPPLHDLRTLLAMATRSGEALNDGRLVEALRDHAWRVQDGLERALRRLQPPALGQADLRSLLADGPLWEWARDQSAHWATDLAGPLQTLPEGWKALLYRMAQAGLDHGLARGLRHFTLRLAVAPGPVGLDVLWQLDIADARMSPLGDGGLDAIRDRALAAGGRYRCTPLSEGVRHEVRFEGVGVTGR